MLYRMSISTGGERARAISRRSDMNVLIWSLIVFYAMLAGALGLWYFAEWFFKEDYKIFLIKEREKEKCRTTGNMER